MPAAATILCCLLLIADPLPEVIVDRDNVVIDRSCRVVIPADAVIPDADGNGVIHVAGDGVMIEFAPGALLRGATASTPDDRLVGTGIRVSGSKGVTIRGAAVAGYRVGLHATDCDGLSIAGVRVDRNFRQRLRSTPLAEDQSDWLWPHRNDDGEWLKNYGAAVCIERSRGVTISGVRTRNSQNGIILDRVTGSKVFDCDCSFLSGWGLALWRSSDNIVSRNAFDFCIRGYSHGVYNRGEDSAGILCFEQCSGNIFIENSATHGGDGFFGFAGREALGEAPAPQPDFDYAGRGCNGNLLIGNDFSFAAAHGIEMTFSFNNRFQDNRLVGNAICGVWAGYSQRTAIAGNTISDNGLPGAREGGGINIEHGACNTIEGNTFSGSSVGVSLWTDEDPGIMKLPWAAANHRGSRDNFIVGNSFTDEATYLRLRSVRGTRVLDNTLVGSASEADLDADSSIIERMPAPDSPADCLPAGETGIAESIGESRPVGARSALAGREHIIMGEWGPWDHQTPMLRLASRTSSRAVHEVYGDAGPLTIDVLDGKGDLETDLGPVEPGLPRTLTLQARAGIQVLPYEVRVTARGIDQTLRGTLVRSPWVATVFPFTVDPRVDPDGWRAESRAPAVAVTPCDDLTWMRLLRRGPGDLPMFREAAREGKLGMRERYGVIARTSLLLPAGKWRFTTLSDDGVRVLVAGTTVIENWTHHAPTRDSGTFEQPSAAEIELIVEYFQLDGYATLELEIERVTSAP